MTDPFDQELDDLKSALRAATPQPDADRKAANIALAEKNFTRRQESAAQARFTSDHRKSDLFRGVAHMLKAIHPRHALTATTALVAVGLFVYLPITGPRPGSNGMGLPPSREEQAIQDHLAAEEARLRTAQDQAQQQLEQELSTAMADAVAEPLAEPLAEAPVASLVAPAAPMPMVKAAPGYAAMDRPAPLPLPQIEADAETYPDSAPNPVKVTVEDPVSTFSIDVDTASYSVIRSTLNGGGLPLADQVRIEEMVNYFPYDYPAPQGAAPFSTTATVMATPWNPDTRLVHIALQGAKPAVQDRPPLNLVFLLDTSGSMDAPNKLPLLKQSFRLLLGQLRPEDKVAIVTYAGSAGLVLEATEARDSDKILAALEQLGAGGSTAGQAGLQQAYATAATMARDGDVTRVILATDGDFNVGIHDPEALKEFIAQKRDSGTYLSVLGFGRGNLDDATMQALAQTGNGQAAYIDTLAEAQKSLVDQLTGALFPIANDVKIQVEFNPSQVAEYRLIGYETRALNREDFNNDKVDAGEIGAGHAVTALFEITPVGSPARLTDPLRYQAAAPANDSPELGFLRLRYKTPGAADSQLIETPILPGGDTTTDMQFAAAIAGFGQLLQDSPYLGDWSYANAIDLALASRGADPFGYRSQAVQLMRLADSLSR